ncbi:MAG: hypothetical protein ACOX8O_05755 [Christensenellales bacterium]
MKKTVFVVLLCVLTAAVMGACAAPAGADATPAVPSASSAEVTALPATPSVPSASSAEVTALPVTPSPAVPTAAATAGVTETRLGIVTEAFVSGGVNTIRIDYVDMYFGDEAVAKALADGSDAVEKDEHGNYYVFNDYYIRNVNKLIRTFPLAPGCTISVVDPEDPGNLTETVSFDEFRTRMVEEPLMHVKVVGGVIVSMTQQFIP